MPDKIIEAQSAKQVEQPEGALTWAAHNILNPVLNAGPLGIYNTAADLSHLPECHLAVDEAKAYSPQWFVQGFSGGVGAALPFMLAAAGTSKVFRGADGLLAGTKVGEIASPLLGSSRAAAIIGASAYGALQKPDENHSRLGNAAGMALGFLAFDRGNALSAELPLWGKAVAYPATGFAGGLVMSEGSQLLSNGKWANCDQALQSAVQGMTLNTVMPLAQEGIRRAAPRVVAEGQTDEKDVMERPSLTAGDAVHSAPPSSGRQDVEERYPAPQDFSKLTPEEIVNRGFYHPNAKNLDQVVMFKGEPPPTLPDPDVAALEVGRGLQAMPLAKADGDLAVGEWNTAFLKGDKAAYFQKAYSEIVQRHHILTVIEANKAGLARLANDNRYSYALSAENPKGQAVGFLVSPRLKILSTHSYDAVANVDDTHMLRPAFRLDLQDKTTGEKFSAIAVHLKKSSADVRGQQTKILSDAVEPQFKGFIAGDWNTLLHQTDDLDPLYNNGFKLLDPSDTTSTHAHAGGGRIDGFLTKNMPGSLSSPDVHQFFQNPIISGLSNHGLLSSTWRLPSSPTVAASVAAQLALRSGTIANNFYDKNKN